VFNSMRSFGPTSWHSVIKGYCLGGSRVNPYITPFLHIHCNFSLNMVDLNIWFDPYT
jgi:hypothetical protein